MSRLDSLRGKIPRRPSRPDNASGQGRRRTKRQADPAVAAAGRALSDAREVFGDVPRDADADHLVRRARRLVRQAALDEFAREGVSLVQLPEQWGRAELRRADVPGDAAFQEFVGEVLAAIDIAPSSLERDDALELLHAPSSTDPYGLSLEVAADLASFLLSRAWLMERGAFAASAEAGERTGDAANPPGVHGDGPGTDAAATVGLPTQDEFVAGHATHIRDEVRAALVRVVKVPLELKEARDKHRRIAERIAAGEKVDAEPQVKQTAPKARAARAGRLGSSGGTGASSSGLPFGFGGGSASAGSGASGGSGGSGGSSDPGGSGDRTTTGSAWTGATTGRSSSGGSTSSGAPAGGGQDDGTEDGAPRRSIAEQVAALHGFATSETGRKTFEVMRTVGERAFDLYQQREASRDGGSGSGPAGGSRSKKRPPGA